MGLFGFRLFDRVTGSSASVGSAGDVLTTTTISAGSVGRTWTLGSGTDSVTVFQGTATNLLATVSNSSGTSLFIKGQVAAGAAVAGTNPVVISYADLFANSLIPTGITAGGLNVLGSILIDLDGHLLDYTAIGESFSLSFTSSTSGTASTQKAAARYARVYSTGEIATSPVPLFEANTLGAITITFTSGTPTAVSASFACTSYTNFEFSYSMSKTNTPTDILFECELSPDGTYYTPLQNNFWGDLRESTASIGTGTINRSVHFTAAATSIRIKAIATVTSASTITVTSARLFMRNG